jgi:predicted nucleic acid-binding protein
VILVDTSVWVDHLRAGNAALAGLLGRGSVLMHTFIIGEIACCRLVDRTSTLGLLQDLPAAAIAEPDEVLRFIEHRKLHGRGIGYVDVHLLASAAIAGARLWTRDRRLRAVAGDLALAHRRGDEH